MIMVDTSVWIGYFNGKITEQTGILNKLLGKELILMGDLIYTEILQGFQKDTDFKTAKKLLDWLPFSNMLGKEIALSSARNYRALRKNGVTVRKTINVIIGTYCIKHNLHLLFSDKDFEPMVAYLELQAFDF